MKTSIRIFALTLMLTLFLPLSTIQAQLFDKGDKVLSLGIGLGASYDYHWSSYYSPTSPVFWATGDYCLREDLGPGNLGVGAVIAFATYKYKAGDVVHRYGRFMIGGRGTYHFTDLVDKLDLYGGISLGAKFGDTYYHADPSDYILGEVFAGVRYYFTDNFSAMSELGYGISWFKLGVSLKL